jgi:hypothetical protein
MEGDISEKLGEYMYGGVEDKVEAMGWLFGVYEELGLIKRDEWVERRIRSWCEDEMVVWWGPGSSGKTKVGAGLVLWDWLAGHWETNSMVVSTTREMLGERIWGEIVNFWLGLSGAGLWCGELVSSDMVIRYRKGDSRNVLRGVAILRGSRQEALSNLLGVHNERNVVCVDEMQGTRDVVVEALGNRMKEGRFKFLGMGNPTSREDPLGEVSEPVGGWGELDIGKERWRSKMGVRVEFFDGRKSPGVRDKEKYGHLITADDIERKRAMFGEGSLIWWGQVVGFMPPEGIGGKLFDRVLIEERGGMGGLQEGEAFVGDVVRVAGFDPAFSVCGDRAVLVYGDIGKVASGGHKIRYYPPIIFDLSGGKGNVGGMLRDKLVGKCAELGVGAGNLVMDASGVQVGFCDLVEEAFGRIYKVGFGGGAVGNYKDGRQAKEVYSNRVSQIWGVLSEYIEEGMVRGLSKDIVVELCARGVENDGVKIRIESKLEMKKRLGYSPDLADAAALVAVLAREQLGVVGDSVLRAAVRERGNRYKREIREGEYDEREEEVLAVEEQERDAAWWMGMER